MALPISLRIPDAETPVPQHAETRDVSFRGLYFTLPSPLRAGAPLEFVLTLPKEITLAGDVHIRCFGEVLRVDDQSGRCGIAARISRYEFLPPPGAPAAHA